VDQDPSPESDALVDLLGVEVLPTLQFWKNGKRIFEHRGESMLLNRLVVSTELRRRQLLMLLLRFSEHGGGCG